ncbi:hypothetical protein ACWGJT_15135 [Streptomyces xantholiticus]
MPQPGSKKHDTERARLRKEAERSGISDQDANDAANESLQQRCTVAQSGVTYHARLRPERRTPRDIRLTTPGHNPKRGRR